MRWWVPLSIADLAARLCALCLADEGRLVSGTFQHIEVRLFRSEPGVGDADPDVVIAFRGDSPSTSIRRRHVS